MADSLLTLVQNACSEINIPQPASLVGSTDDQSIQLLALAIREGREFSSRAGQNNVWQAMHKEYSFTTNALPATTGNVANGSAVITNIPSTAGITANTWGVTGQGIPNAAFVLSVDSATQITMNQPATASGTGVGLTFGQMAYPLPSDLAFFMTQTIWDGNYRWQLLGPLEAQEKQVLRYGISPVGPRRRFWFRNNLMYINPTPTDSLQTIAYDYQSNAWCQSNAGAPQSTWKADTDTYLLDPDCFQLGLKWRFLQAKGFDYAEHKKTYEENCDKAVSRDAGVRDLALNNRSTNIHLLSNANVPDTGFGS